MVQSWTAARIAVQCCSQALQLQACQQLAPAIPPLQSRAARSTGTYGERHSFSSAYCSVRPRRSTNAAPKRAAAVQRLKTLRGHGQEPGKLTRNVLDSNDMSGEIYADEVDRADVGSESNAMAAALSSSGADGVWQSGAAVP